MYGTKELLKKECQAMKSILEYYQKELTEMPDGYLGRKKVNNNFYYYQQLNVKKNGLCRRIQKHLSHNSSDEWTIALLKRKRFLELSLRPLNVQIKRMEHFLTNFNEFNPTEIENSMSPTYSGIEMKQASSDPSFVINEKAWLTEPFESNPFERERLIHTTSNGLHVRSKSEAIIVNLLDNSGIPFRYEAPLKLDDYTFYPDFTVLRPSDQKVIYWEHFGMISSSNYQSKMDHKLSIYRLYQITPWNNLITTYDDENGSIDARQMSRIIEIFLL